MLHRRVAEAIEQTCAADRESQLADLAQHYHAAGLWAEALDSARRAGQHALRLYAPGAAAEQFTRALEAADDLRLPADSDLLQMRGRAREALGDFDGARADYTQALAAAPNPTRRSEALMDLGALWASRDYAQAGHWLEQAFEAARQTGDDSRVLARASNRLGNWLVNVGRTAEGLELHQQALALLEPHSDIEGLAQTPDLLAMGLGLHGDAFAAAAQFERAAVHFRELGDVEGQASSLATYCAFAGPQVAETSACVLLSLDDARRDGYEAIRLAQQSGLLSTLTFTPVVLAQSLNGFGELGESLEHGLAAQRIATEIEHEQWQTGALCALGEAYVAALAPETAIEVLEDAFRRARRCDLPGGSATRRAIWHWRMCWRGQPDTCAVHAPGGLAARSHPDERIGAARGVGLG